MGAVVTKAVDEGARGLASRARAMACFIVGAQVRGREAGKGNEPFQRQTKPLFPERGVSSVIDKFSKGAEQAPCLWPRGWRRRDKSLLLELSRATKG